MSEDLLALMRSICPTDSNLKKVSMGKQKATNIICHVLGFQFTREGCKLLSEKKFLFSNAVVERDFSQLKLIKND